VRGQFINAAVVLPEVYVCAVFLMVKEVGSALQKRAGNTTYTRAKVVARLQPWHEYNPLRQLSPPTL